jgi:hypothetical protein
MASVSPVLFVWSRGFRRSPAPADVLLTADAGTLAPLGGQYAGIGGDSCSASAGSRAGRASARCGLVVGVGDGELPQGSEVCLDRLAQEAQVGVKHSLTLFLFAQRRMSAPLWADRFHDDVDRGTSGRAARIDFSAARVFAAPFLRRLTPHRVSSPIEYQPWK